MATNNPPGNTPRPTVILRDLLDRQYTNAAGQVIRAIVADSERGPIANRLRQFDDRAAELEAAGQKLKADDPVLRALIADYEDALSRQALLIDQAAPQLINASGQTAGSFVQQTSLPGMNLDAAITAGWNMPDPEAINAAVNFTLNEQWRYGLVKYGPDIAGQVQNIAIRGIVGGRGPRNIARDLRAAVPSIPRHRAETLLRTLQIQSFRVGTSVHQIANQEVIDYQVRVATLDSPRAWRVWHCMVNGCRWVT